MILYRIDKQENKLEEITVTTFAENEIKERQHIEEWIRKNPEILGEDLLIIGHEYSYDKLDINERLDLLALDRNGNVVVIEVKRDQSGKDVDFQALKYASYCARLSQKNLLDIYANYLIKHNEQTNPKDALQEFLNAEDEEDLNAMLNGTQRIIIVGKDFDKRILSVCTWLYENNIDIKCVSIKPYKLNDEIVVDVKQIIPPDKLEDYYIKKKEEKQKKEIQIDQNIIDFLTAVQQSIRDETGYNSSYSRNKKYFVGRKLLGIPWNFVVGYKEDGTAAISLETNVAEGREKINYVVENYGEQLQQILSVPIDLREGTKNKDWLRLVVEKKLDTTFSLEKRVQQFTELFKNYYDFIIKLRDKNEI